MSRFSYFTHAMASGYALLGANVLFTLAQVPLALTYLDQEEFGLWALVTQITTVLLLLEFGVSGSLARILIDHKVNKAGRAYASTVKAGAYALFTQGVCIGLVGYGVSHFASSWLNIDAKLALIFQNITALQCAITGSFFVLRTFTLILEANQRFDLINISQLLGLGTTLLVQWLAFSSSWGLMSLPVASAAGAITSFGLSVFFVRKQQLWPINYSSSHLEWNKLGEIFALGGKYLVMSIGLLLLTASQVIIITKILGLTEAAVWSIATRLYSISFQGIARIFDFAGPALGEMIARQERYKLRSRFLQILAVTTSASFLAGGFIVAANSDFLCLWTGGRIAWNPVNNYLVAFLLILNCTSRCYINLAMYAKSIETLKWIYLLESMAFVLFALLLTPWLGLAGVLLSAIVSNLACSGSWALIWSSDYLRLPVRMIAASGFIPATRMLLPIGVAVLFCGSLFTALPAAGRLSIIVIVVLSIGLPSFWVLGFPRRLQRELKSRLTSLM